MFFSLSVDDSFYGNTMAFDVVSLESSVVLQLVRAASLQLGQYKKQV